MCRFIVKENHGTQHAEDTDALSSSDGVNIYYSHTCPSATLPLPSASGQLELGLHAPRSRNPLYRLPTPPG